MNHLSQKVAKIKRNIISKIFITTNIHDKYT